MPPQNVTSTGSASFGTAGAAAGSMKAPRRPQAPLSRREALDRSRSLALFRPRSKPGRCSKSSFAFDFELDLTKCWKFQTQTRLWHTINQNCPRTILFLFFFLSCSGGYQCCGWAWWADQRRFQRRFWSFCRLWCRVGRLWWWWDGQLRFQGRFWLFCRLWFRLWRLWWVRRKRGAIAWNAFTSRRCRSECAGISSHQLQSRSDCIFQQCAHEAHLPCWSSARYVSSSVVSVLLIAHDPSSLNFAFSGSYAWCSASIRRHSRSRIKVFGKRFEVLCGNAVLHWLHFGAARYQASAQSAGPGLTQRWNALACACAVIRWLDLILICHRDRYVYIRSWLIFEMFKLVSR